MGQPSRHADRDRLIRLLPWIIVLLGAAPLLVATPAPLQDWPNHLSRVHILDAMLRGDPFWNGLYTFNGFFVPNALLDLGVLGLLRLGLGLDLAGMLFLLITYAVFVGGMCALARVLGRLDLIRVALATVLFTNSALRVGLVNYVFGVGLACLLLAACLSLPRAGPRIVIAVAGAAGLFFCHIVAAVCFVVLLACLDLPRRRGLRPALAAAPLAGLALLVLLRMHPAETDDPTGLVWAGADVWRFAAWKAEGFAAVAFGGAVWLQGLTAVLLAGLALIIAASRPRLGMGVGLALAVSVLLPLAAPERIGTGSLLDYRLALIPVLLLAVCWRPTRALSRPAVAGLLVLCALHAAAFAVEWRRGGAVFDEFAEAIAGITPGGTVLMAFGRPLATVPDHEYGSPAITALGTTAARHGLFVPLVFANPSQQPIALRPAYAGLNQPLDMSDGAHRRGSFRQLATLCAGPAPMSRVTVVVLFASAATRAALEGAATIAASRSFLVLDGCALHDGVS